MSSPQHSRPQKLRKKNWTNQEGILRVRRSLKFRGKKSGSNQKFLTYGQGAKKCWFVGETFLAELSTPHSICSEKRFEPKGFYFKKKQIGYSFLILTEEIPDLWRKFSTRVSKTKSTWPEGFVGETFFGRRYNFIYFDGFSEEILICKKTPSSSVKHSTRPVEHSKGQISGRKRTFLTFGLWARMF